MTATGTTLRRALIYFNHNPAPAGNPATQGDRDMKITVQSKVLSDGSEVYDLILSGDEPNEKIPIRAVGDGMDALDVACDIAMAIEKATCETVDVISG